MIKNDRVLTKFDEIQGKIKGLLELHSKPIYDEKYIKTKARSFNGETSSRDSIMRMDIFRIMQVRCKRENDGKLYRR